MKARPKRTKAIRYRPPHNRTRSNITIIIKAIQNCLIITLFFIGSTCTGKDNLEP